MTHEISIGIAYAVKINSMNKLLFIYFFVSPQEMVFEAPKNGEGGGEERRFSVIDSTNGSKEDIQMQKKETPSKTTHDEEV